jgi:hypothetical protein
MRSRNITLLFALLVAFVLIVAAQADTKSSGEQKMDTVRDHLWLWCHETGANNGQYSLPRTSRMSPAEAAYYLDIPNVLMIVYGDKPEPPFDQLSIAFRPLKNVVWSIIGDSSSKRNDKATDISEVTRLANKFPNITGGMMDDFFHPANEKGEIARYSASEIAAFRDQLHKAAHGLDLWVVLYSHNLDLPVQEHIKNCDVVTFWTWNAADLADLDKNFERLEKAVGSKRKILGCYMWDFGAGKPIPLDTMKKQCESGLKWLKEGRIDGMIFLSSVICDMELEAVEWTRKWIAEVGDQPLARKTSGGK